jgi:hypothetical protein
MNLFKVLKPHDKLVDKMIDENYVELRKHEDWPQWNYLAKVRNETGRRLWDCKMGEYGRVFIIKRPGELERTDDVGKYGWFRFGRQR